MSMKEELEKKIGLEVVENELLKNHTTFRIGGPAKFFVRVTNKQELLKAIQACHEFGLKYFLLGGGSNILVADKGFDGLVIKTEKGKIDIDGNFVTAFAGANLMYMVREIVKQGLGGLEFAANIPGTVGGGVRGNAGAYGKGLGDFVKEVEVIVINDDEVSLKILTKEECEFAYRESIFKKELTWVIAEIGFELESDVKAEEKMKEIQKEWGSRCAKQPMAYPSAGCSFKNLVFDPKEHEKFKEWEIKGKLPVARLVEEADLKGLKIGGAMVSDKHANFILNYDNATADHVAQLISLVKTRLRNELGVDIDEEVQYIGF